MAVIKVPTNFNIDLEFEIPEFYRRLVSLLIDIVIQYFYFRIAEYMFDRIAKNTRYSIDNEYNLEAFGLLLFLPIMLYHVVMEITMNGQSVGKRIMGIRVVNEIGGRPGISQFLIRWILRISDAWIIILIYLLLTLPYHMRSAETTFLVIAGVAFLITDIVLVVSSKKGQRIGDLLAKTILIRINTKGNIEETVFREVADNYVPSFPQIMQLSDKDINAIKSILETARKKGDFHMAEAASIKIKTHLRIDSNMDPFDFLEVLLKDYNFLSTR
jgi:uncharacterized RDD family membrane protein YckC